MELIKDLNIFILKNELKLLCNSIKVIYDIDKFSDEFIEYLSNTLKKYFDYLTIEQIKEAFELNSTGSIPGLKIRMKFAIPEFSQILKSYVQYRKLKKNVDFIKIEPTDEEKNKMINDWCDSLCKKFDTYKITKEKLPLRIPLFYACVMAKIGLINPNQINKKERLVNFKNIKNYQADTINESLVYNLFDEMISNNEHINSYLTRYRQSYLNGINYDYESMPFS